MKYIIIGKQGSGKFAILRQLQEMGIRVGHEFSNLPEKPDKVYMDPDYEFYPMDDINKVFETKSYIYIGGIEETGINNSYIYYRGLSYYTYDNSDVISISPVQLEQLNKTLMTEPVTFIWLDNKRDARIRLHAEENRTHSFLEQEAIESRTDSDFVKNLYNFPNSQVLYFTNELPNRVAAVIAALIKHPDLHDIFIENFN